MPDNPLSLAHRRALAEDLRWLLARHPRPSWQSTLGEIGRFWLARHAMFRETQAVLLAETRAFVAGATEPARFGPRFLHLAGFLLGELDSHHGVEDHHYFPRLARIEPRLQRGFELLDADHHALHETLEALAAAAEDVRRGLRTDTAQDPADRAADGLDALGRLLDRHLADEEDIVAPILIAHGERGLG